MAATSFSIFKYKHCNLFGLSVNTGILKNLKIPKNGKYIVRRELNSQFQLSRALAVEDGSSMNLLSSFYNAESFTKIQEQKNGIYL